MAYCFARYRGVGRDYPIHAVPSERQGDRLDCPVFEVRSNFEEQRNTTAGPGVEPILVRTQGLQQGIKCLLLLQLAQVAGVWRRNVDTDVVGPGMYCVKPV